MRGWSDRALIALGPGSLGKASHRHFLAFVFGARFLRISRSILRCGTLGAYWYILTTQRKLQNRNFSSRNAFTIGFRSFNLVINNDMMRYTQCLLVHLIYQAQRKLQNRIFRRLSLYKQINNKPTKMHLEVGLLSIDVAVCLPTPCFFAKSLPSTTLLVQILLYGIF